MSWHGCITLCSLYGCVHSRRTVVGPSVAISAPDLCLQFSLRLFVCSLPGFCIMAPWFRIEHFPARTTYARVSGGEPDKIWSYKAWSPQMASFSLRSKGCRLAPVGPLPGLCLQTAPRLPLAGE